MYTAYITDNRNNNGNNSNSNNIINQIKRRPEKEKNYVTWNKEKNSWGNEYKNNYPQCPSSPPPQLPLPPLPPPPLPPPPKMPLPPPPLPPPRPIPPPINRDNKPSHLYVNIVINDEAI